MRTTTTTTTRRNALKATAALAGSGLALGGLTLFGSRPAAAEVTATFDVPSATYRHDHAPEQVFLQASGTWSYSNVDVDPTEARVTLEVGESPDNRDDLAFYSTVPFGFDEGGQFSCQGDLTETAIWSDADFAAGDGQQVSVDVYATARLEVFDGDTVIATASDSGTGTVTVEDTTVLYNADLTGQASWAFVNDSADPTPTPP